MTTMTHAFPWVPRRIVIHKWHVVVLLGAIVFGLGMIHSHEVVRVDVKTATPAIGDIASTVSAVGAVVPVNDFPARANFSGMVEKIYVRLGQQVQAGQMLIDLKDQYADSRVANARAAFESAEVNNENVEQNGSKEDRIGFATDVMKARSEQSTAASALSTLKQLQANGSVSEAEVAGGVQRLQAANAALNDLMERSTQRYSKTDIASWNARVAAEKASMDAEKVSFANAHISSPIAGTVYELPVSKYDFVPGGADLLHVADLSKMRIHADFYELDVDKLRVGQPVKITWEGSPNHSWPGRVVEKPLAVTGEGIRRMGRATIEINDQKGDLPVNTNVTVQVTVARDAHVLTIPREALHTEGSAYYTYRIVDGSLQKTPVEVGIFNPERAEITKGLAAHDVIALHAMNDEKLTDKLKVKTSK
jgi:HlyD family secretion protein